MDFPVPPDEIARLAALRSLKILDTLPDERFDRIVRIALTHYRMPVVRISFVDEDRVWFKARIGIKAQQAPRSISICAHTVMSGDVLVVPDLTANPRFAQSPQVTGEPHFRFYAAVPIAVQGDFRIGSVCLMDYVPHPDFSREDATFLQELAEIVVDALGLHEKIVAHEAIIDSRTKDLKDSEERFALAMRGANDGLWDWNLATDEVYFSPRWFRMLGYEPGELPAKLDTWASLVEPAGKERVMQLAQDCISGASETFETEFRMRHKNGSWVSIWARAFLATENGKPVRIVGTHVDVSERNKLVEQVNQAQKMEAVGQLTGGVAHNFNNLLAVILGNIELLEDEIGDNQLLASINRAAARGAELTQRLLAFSRQQTLVPRSINLAELIASLDDLFRRTLGEPIKISANVGADIWPVFADPGQLENALLNLAINARDAMPKGGILEIWCSNIELQKDDSRVGDDVVAGEYVQISVRHTGTGMTKETVEHAFEPFYTTKDVGEGSGLGLSMVYGFAQQSGGDAVIESEPGSGTEVRLFLPRSDTAARMEERTQDSDLKRGRGEVILVLENDPDVRQLAVTILDGLGYKALEAANANAAMRVLEDQSENVVLLLSDVVLPGGVSGPEFAAKAKDQNSKMKVVFMTGYASDPDAIDKIPGIGEALLAKSFKRTDLATVIHDTLAT